MEHGTGLPAVLYKNKLTTYLGFTEAGFASSDYFSLFPWLFLYLAGYYAFRISARQGRLPDAFGRGQRLFEPLWPSFSWPFICCISHCCTCC